MKNIIRIAALLSAAALFFNTAGCSSKKAETSSESKTIEDYDFVASDVETQYDVNALMMLTSENDVFRDTISKDDIEVYAIIPTKNKDDLTQITDFEVSYMSPTQIMLNINTEARVEMISAMVKKTGTTNDRVLCAASKEIKRTYGNADTDMAAMAGDIEAIKKMLTKGIFDYASSAISAGAGAYSALQAVGLIDDPVQSALTSIQKNLDIVSEQIISIDGKLDSMYNSLDEKLSTIDRNTRKSLHNSYEQIWSSFDDKNYLQSQIQSFTNLYCDNFCNYTANLSGTFNIYYDTDGMLTEPATKSHKEGTEWKSVDGTIIDESCTISIDITDETFIESSSMINKSIDNEEFISAMKNELRNALLTNEQINEENADTYLTDALTAISIDVLRQTMKEKTSTGTVADNIIDTYQTFCNALQRNTSNPIDAYRKLIISNYNFQSEAVEDIKSFNEYILLEAVAFRGYAELAANYGNVSSAKKNGIASNSEKLAAYIENNDGLVPEQEGMQYFYETESYISVTQYTAQFKETVTGTLYHPFYFMYGGSYKSHYSSYGWDREPKNLIPTDSLEMMKNKYYSIAEKDNYPDSFKTYFYEKLVSIRPDTTDIPCYNAEGVISGSNTAIRDFTLDGTTKLRTYNDIFNGYSPDALIDDPLEFFIPNKEYKIGTEFNDSDAKKDYFVLHKSFYGDLLNLSTAEVKRNVQLSSAAMFIDHRLSYYTDEMWEFAGFNPDLPNQDEWAHVYTSQSGDYTRFNLYGYDIPLTYNLNSTATFWAVVSN